MSAPNSLGNLPLFPLMPRIAYEEANHMDPSVNEAQNDLKRKREESEISTSEENPPNKYAKICVTDDDEKTIKLVNSKLPNALQTHNTSPVQKNSKYELWSSKESNSLMKLIPEHQSSTNPYAQVKIEVQISDEEDAIFWAPQFVLNFLSPHFKNVFSQKMKEGSTKCIRWVGPSNEPNIHKEAAAQIIQYAHVKCHVLDHNNDRSLAQLKEKLPQEFEVIFKDMIKLSYFYEMNDVKVECSQLIANEIQSDFEGKSVEWFQWALSTQNQQDVLKCALKLVSQNPLDRLKIYSIFISIFEADYSECTVEEKRTAERFLEECFLEVIPSSAKEEELVEICSCFVKLFPRFEFSNVILSKIAACSNKFDTKKTNNPLLFYVVELCQQNQFTHSPRLLSSSRPKAGHAFKKYEELLEAMIAPKSSRITLLDKIILKNPENIYAIKLRYFAYYLKNEHQEAIDNLNQLLNLKPNDSFALSQRARNNLILNNINAALKDFNLALEYNPNDASVLNSRAECHFRNKNYVATLQDYDRAIEIKSNYVNALIGRGNFQYIMHNWDAALKDFNQVLKITPTNILALGGRGNCLFKKGDIQAALQDYNTILKQPHRIPTEGTILFNRANCYYKMGNFEAAIEDFNKGIEQTPLQNIPALKVRGQCHYMMGNLESAIKDFIQILEVHPSHCEALTGKGNCLLKMDDPDSAILDFNHALQYQPKHLLALIGKGKCLLKMAKPDEAMEIFYPMSESYPNDVVALIGLGECFRLQGKIKEAQESYDYALQLHPNDPTILELKAKCSLK